MAKTDRKRPLTPIGSILKTLLSKLDLHEDTAERGKAMLAWEIVAGDASKHSEPAHFCSCCVRFKSCMAARTVNEEE